MTRSWTGVYTTGLSRQVARERRDKVGSDLWEQEANARAVGAGAQSTAAHTVAWVVLGRRLARLLGGVAPVDEEIGAGHIRGLVAREEKDAGRNLFRLPGPSEHGVRVFAGYLP